MLAVWGQHCVSPPTPHPCTPIPALPGLLGRHGASNPPTFLPLPLPAFPLAGRAQGAGASGGEPVWPWADSMEVGNLLVAGGRRLQGKGLHGSHMAETSSMLKLWGGASLSVRWHPEGGVCKSPVQGNRPQPYSRVQP